MGEREKEIGQADRTERERERKRGIRLVDL